MRSSELKAVAWLLAIAAFVLTLLPDRTIDPWAIVNPRSFGIIVLVIASIEFCGYLASRLLGANKGIWLTGFLGGLVSSTAVTLTSARAAQTNPERWRREAASAAAAQLAAILTMLPILASTSSELLKKSLPMICSSGAVALVGMIWAGARALKETEDVILKSPLDLKNVARLSLFLIAILILISIAQLFIGEIGSLIVSFFTGLFELHGLSLANAVLYIENKIHIEDAVRNITIAMCASFLAKALIAAAIARGRFSVFMFALAAGTSAACLIAWAATAN